MATDFFLAAKFSFLSRDRGYTEHLLSKPLWHETNMVYQQKNPPKHQTHTTFGSSQVVETLTHKLQHSQKVRRRRPSPRCMALSQHAPDEYQKTKLYEPHRGGEMNQICLAEFTAGQQALDCYTLTVWQSKIKHCSWSVLPSVLTMDINTTFINHILEATRIFMFSNTQDYKGLVRGSGSVKGF